MQRRKSVSRIFELIVGGLGALVSLVSSSFILLIGSFGFGATSFLGLIATLGSFLGIFASIHVFKDTETAEQVAAKIANYVNNNTATLGLTAAVSTATVTVTATEPAVDYEITMADALSGTTVTYTTRGEIGIADAEAIKKMANMAAADAGFEYTYMDDVHYLYPNYPLNPNTGTNTTDAGYTVYTLRFAVPRDVKTRDELVHQIVQIAIPTEAPQIATMDTILAGIKSVA